VVTLSTGPLRAGGRVAGPDAIQQAARADRELGEDLCRWYGTVRALMRQPAADLRLDRPSRASRAITAS
jgi:hypothetical protein